MSESIHRIHMCSLIGSLSDVVITVDEYHCGFLVFVRLNGSAVPSVIAVSSVNALCLTCRSGLVYSACVTAY